MIKRTKLVRGGDLLFGFMGTFGHWCYFHDEDQWESGYLKVTYGYVTCYQIVEEK